MPITRDRLGRFASGSGASKFASKKKSVLLQKKEIQLAGKRMSRQAGFDVTKTANVKTAHHGDKNTTTGKQKLSNAVRALSESRLRRKMYGEVGIKTLANTRPPRSRR